MRTFRRTANCYAARAFLDVLEFRVCLSGGTVSGQVFLDRNQNGVFDGNDFPIANSTVYLDDDEDLLVDVDEKWALTDAQGAFVIDDVSTGEHRVQYTLPDGGQSSFSLSPASLTPDFLGLPVMVSDDPGQSTSTNLQLTFRSVGSQRTYLWTGIFNDTNQDGIRQTSEPYLNASSGTDIGFIDHNANGVYDGNVVDEPLAKHPTGANLLAPNRYAIYHKPLANYVLTKPEKQLLLLAPAVPNVYQLVGMVIPATKVSQVTQNIDIRLGTIDVQFDRALSTTGGGINSMQIRNAAGQNISVSRSVLASPNAYRLRPNSTLPNGVYTLYIPSTALAGTTDTPPPDYTYSFTVLQGDLDLDGTVDFDDLLTIAQNYGLSGRSYSQGNLTRDSSGRVDFDDLLLLAQSYGNTVVPTQWGDGLRKDKRSSAASRMSL